MDSLIQSFNYTPQKNLHQKAIEKMLGMEDNPTSFWGFRIISGENWLLVLASVIKLHKT